MLSSTQAVNLYLVINKLMYKHAELGVAIYNKSRNPDVDNQNFKELLQLSSAIDSLLETDDSIVLEGVDYPYYGVFEGQELDQYLDYLSSTYELDPVPYVDFPKNTTNFISTGNTIETEETTLPDGGGVGFYLTKNASGNLIWREIDIIESDFNSL